MPPGVKIALTQPTQKSDALTAVDRGKTLQEWARDFYLTKKSEGVSEYTLVAYRQQLDHFLKYCDAQVITLISQLTPTILREFMVWHAETHNPGGQHLVYRVLRTFLRWYGDESDDERWKNPIRKVKAPKIPQEHLEPASLEDISRLIDICSMQTFLDLRDRAITMFLLDTGARSGETLQVNIADADLISGEVIIQQGKGRKARVVFLGKASRKAIKTYLKIRKDENLALWVTEDGKRLQYGGLREIIQRRSRQAGIDPPSLHSFRRAFAINMLRAGVDVYSLQELMGHSDLTVLRRYLKQTNEDLRAAHLKGSPVDGNI